jgi:hypothetical protein
VPEFEPFRHAQSSIPATWTALLPDRALACSFRLARIVVSLTGIPSRLSNRSAGRPPVLWPSSRTIFAKRVVRRERRRETRQAFGEDALITLPVATPPAPEAGVHNDRRALGGQIPKRSRVGEVLWRELDSAPHLGQAGGSRLSTMTVHACPRGSTLTIFKPAAGDQVVDVFIVYCSRIQSQGTMPASASWSTAPPRSPAPRVNQTP